MIAEESFLFHQTYKSNKRYINGFIRIQYSISNAIVLSEINYNQKLIRGVKLHLSVYSIVQLEISVLSSAVNLLLSIVLSIILIKPIYSNKLQHQLSYLIYCILDVAIF